MEKKKKKSIRHLREERLTGWGKYPVALTYVSYPETIAELRSLASWGEGHRLARGRGRSYGDASLNSGRVTVRFDRLDRAVSFDHEQGTFTCEAGMTLGEIIQTVLPYGWFIPVTPGTGTPTLGGSFACDVHGKNHHVAGSIARHVEWIDLVTASGDVVRCSPGENSDLFSATAGGLGLTGMIHRMKLKLARVPSAYIAAEHVRVKSLPEMMESLERSDEAGVPYSVAWVDGTAGGSQLGRGEVIVGDHARVEQLPLAMRRTPFKPPLRRLLEVPVTPPLPMVNPASIRVFNEIYVRKNRGRDRWEKIEPYGVFFYPLDSVKYWNRLYGIRGFVQYQFVIPFDGAEMVLRRILNMCRESGHVSALTVLKRMGRQEGLLSFPMPGWTLAMDLPRRSRLEYLLNEFDAIVVGQGGRVYLAKDSRLGHESFRAMYPRFKEWLQIKRRVDPDGVFASDLSRRLRMNEEE